MQLLLFFIENDKLLNFFIDSRHFSGREIYFGGTKGKIRPVWLA
jgi:hypothetical protein